MAGAKKKQQSTSKRTATRKKTSLLRSDSFRKKAVLLLIVLIAVGAIVVFTWVLPKYNGAKSGVGADGFSVYEMKGADLGVANSVSKEDVQRILGDQVKSVSDVKKSGVINLNGAKGQTATFPIVTKGDQQASFYVDVLEYKNVAALEDSGVTKGTVSAGKINDSPAYYMKSNKLGDQRETTLLVSKGPKSYKFVIAQPRQNITISEAEGLEKLIEIAKTAKL